MFDLFSWSHLLIIAIVALVVIGPKDLPRLMRTAGQWAAKARTVAGEFRNSFEDMARQSELDELRQEIDSLRGRSLLATPEAAMPRVDCPAAGSAAASYSPQAPKSEQRPLMPTPVEASQPRP